VLNLHLVTLIVVDMNVARNCYIVSIANQAGCGLTSRLAVHYPAAAGMSHKRYSICRYVDF
jgi:hypothetical protein